MKGGGGGKVRSRFIEVRTPNFREFRIKGLSNSTSMTDVNSHVNSFFRRWSDH